MRPRPRWRVAVAVGVAVVLVSCSSNEKNEATEKQLARQLVDATRAAGILPDLTPDVVAALYGTDASAVCDAFDGGITTPAANRLLGNPGHGRRVNVTDTAVTYARLVIETYCPEVLPDFDEAIESVDPVEVTR